MKEKFQVYVFENGNIVAFNAGFAIRLVCSCGLVVVMEAMKNTPTFKVGERVLVRFKRYDGSWHHQIGTITRLWGKRHTYAATVLEDDGPIRAAIQDLVKLK